MGRIEILDIRAGLKNGLDIGAIEKIFFAPDVSVIV